MNSLLERWAAKPLSHVISYCFCLFFLGICLLAFAGDYLGEYDDPLGLFGQALIPSLGVILTSLPFTLLGAYTLRRYGADGKSIGLYVLASVITLTYINTSDNQGYTNDVEEHIARIIHTYGHPFNSLDAPGWEKHHPPTYYYAASAPLWINRHIPGIAMRTALRFFSWVLFQPFMIFGLLIVRRAQLPVSSYLPAGMLLLFWPASIHLASKISNETLSYSLYAVSFFFALRWYQEQVPKDLRLAFFWAGAAIAVRTNDIIIFPVLFLLILYRRHRGGAALGRLREWWPVAAAMPVFMLINITQLIHNAFTAKALRGHFGNQRPYVPLPWDQFFYINIKRIFTYPFDEIYSPQQSYWDYFFRTSLFGEYHWDFAYIASAMEVLLGIIVLTALYGLLKMCRTQLGQATPFVLALLVPIGCHIMLVLYKVALTNQDARHIYFFIIGLAACYGYGLTGLEQRNWRALAVIGKASALVFCGLGIFFFLAQVRTGF